MKKSVFVVSLICNIIFVISACVGSNTENKDTSIVYPDVAAINEEAWKAYEAGQFEESLIKYAEAMKENPIDMDSRIGLIQCQMAMENYDLAATNLSAAFKVDPRKEILYELYIDLSEKSDNIFYARQAVELAKTYQIHSILDKIPLPPQFGIEGGKYSNRLELELTAENGTEIVIVEKKDGEGSSAYKYNGPFSITRGVTELEAYCIKNGIPSDVATARYICEYDPKEVTFEDPVFEKIVRASIGNIQGAITDEECEEITSLEQHAMQSSGMDYEEYRSQKIYTLNDLYWFPNLERLYLDEQDTIEDFSPIVQCRKLNSLNIRDSGLSDISFVGNLSNLDYLEMRGNEITDVTPLSFCTELYNLDISGNPVNDLKPLTELDLLYFSADVSQISDEMIIRGWKNLRSLSLTGCGGFDGNILKGMTNLEQLYLYARNDYDEKSTPLGDISFLEGLINLERLTLSGLADYSQIGSSVKNLSNLTYLYFNTLGYSDPPESLIEELKISLPGCEIHY